MILFIYNSTLSPIKQKVKAIKDKSLLTLPNVICKFLAIIYQYLSNQ